MGGGSSTCEDGASYRVDMYLRCVCGGGEDDSPNLYGKVYYAEIPAGENPNYSSGKYSHIKTTSVASEGKHAEFSGVHTVTCKPGVQQVLVIDVYDYDKSSADDWIGQTEDHPYHLFVPKGGYADQEPIVEGTKGELTTCPGQGSECGGHTGHVYFKTVKI